MHANPSQRVAADFTWRPTAEQLEAANVARLARALGCSDYDELHALSIDEPDRFWRAVVDDLGIPLARDWDAVLDDSRGIEWTTWFEGARAERRRCVRPSLGARDARRRRRQCGSPRTASGAR